MAAGCWLAAAWCGSVAQDEHGISEYIVTEKQVLINLINRLTLYCMSLHVLFDSMLKVGLFDLHFTGSCCWPL